MHWLFDSSVFIARSHCGSGWTEVLMAINRVANLLIFFAYFTLPISLLYVWVNMRKRFKDEMGVQPWINLTFAIFIFSCGLTHLCDVIVFDYAPYRLYTLIDVITAITSVPTAILVPMAFKKMADHGKTIG